MKALDTFSTNDGKVITAHSPLITNICIYFHGNLSNSYKDNPFKIFKTVDQTDTAIRRESKVYLN